MRPGHQEFFPQRTARGVLTLAAYPPAHYSEGDILMTGSGRAGTSRRPG